MCACAGGGGACRDVLMGDHAASLAPHHTERLIRAGKSRVHQYEPHPACIDPTTMLPPCTRARPVRDPHCLHPSPVYICVLWLHLSHRPALPAPRPLPPPLPTHTHTHTHTPGPSSPLSTPPPPPMHTHTHTHRPHTTLCPSHAHARVCIHSASCLMPSSWLRRCRRCSARNDDEPQPTPAPCLPPPRPAVTGDCQAAV